MTAAHSQASRTRTSSFAATRSRSRRSWPTRAPRRAFFAEESLDWVPIDARHEHASAKADIATWLPKIRVGGWLSRDDDDELKWPEVLRAVDEVLPEAEPWSTGQWRVVIA